MELTVMENELRISAIENKIAYVKCIHAPENNNSFINGNAYKAVCINRRWKLEGIPPVHYDYTSLNEILEYDNISNCGYHFNIISKEEYESVEATTPATPSFPWDDEYIDSLKTKAESENIAYIKCTRQSSNNNDYKEGKIYIATYCSEWIMKCDTSGNYSWDELNEILDKDDAHGMNCGHHFNIVSKEEYDRQQNPYLPVKVECTWTVTSSFVIGETYSVCYDDLNSLWKIKSYNDRNCTTVDKLLQYVSPIAKFKTIGAYTPPPEVVWEKKDYYVHVIKKLNNNYSPLEEDNIYKLTYNEDEANWKITYDNGSYDRYTKPINIVNGLKNYYKLELVTDEFYQKFLDEVQTEEYMVNKLSKSVEKMLETEKNKLKNEYDHVAKEVIDYKKYLIEKVNKKYELETRLKTTDADCALKTALISEIDKIRKHDLTDSVVFTTTNTVITTKPLYIYEPQTERRYLLGSMKMLIPFNTQQEPAMFNLDRNISGYSGGMHHPHIFKDGNPCYGNSGGMIASYLAANELYALYVTLLNYCQTCDINDEAGWYVCKFPEVNENNEIIHEGHSPVSDEYNGNGCGSCEGDDDDYHTCAVCGRRFFYEDGYQCEDCGDWFCDEHARYYEELDENLCERCANKHDRCDDCGDLIYHGDEHVVEGGRTVCPNCFNNSYEECAHCGEYFKPDDMTATANGEQVCNDCLNGHYTQCAECEEWFSDEDEEMTEIEGKFYCSECAEERNVA